MKGGVRELKNVIARAVFYAKFGGKRQVDEATLTMALEQALPSVSREGAEDLVAGFANSKDDERGTEIVVSALRSKLKELGVNDSSLVGPNVMILPYRKIGDCLPNAVRKDFVKWCQEYLEKEHVEERLFLKAVDYRLKGRTPRNTIWGRWKKDL